MASTSTTLDSREVILNNIINNLKDEDINMVGICGMGGVGKTTMVDKVLKWAKKENMFDDYAKTVVSQKADTTKVQRDVAEMLGLILFDENPEVRASRLNQRLEGRKTLIVLDDIWEELDLQTLGITLEGGQKRCKIVFTSRTQGLWTDFQSRRRELSLDTLPQNESWNLFKEKIGDFLDEKPEFVSIAEQIVRECAGLPLALVTLGRALLGKCKHAWNDTLVKLRTNSGVEQKVYVSLRQSYDHLGNEEAQSLLLLCRQFEEDSSIYVESLVSMGMELRLFNGINSIEAARDRVFSLVEHLQSRYLVFANSEDNKSITIHDLVRDVLKSISRDKGTLIGTGNDELGSLRNLITDMIIRHDSDLKYYCRLSELFSAIEVGEGVVDLRRVKKLNMNWRKGASTTPTLNDINNIKDSLFFPIKRYIENNYNGHGMTEMLEENPFFMNYKERYHELREELKLCLLCLAAFPENAKVKRRVLGRWWIGEGFGTMLDELISQGFLAPVKEEVNHNNHYNNNNNNNNNITPRGVNTYRMHPRVRSVVMKLAKDAGFVDVDLEGNVTEDYWLATGNQHIQVLTTKSMNNKMNYVHALDGLENVKHLRLLNLEGFSRIRKLPNCISKLTYLTTLNLRACHYLEFLPEEIGRLNKLTHLDMSECYLLDHMPKDISKLTKIQLLKGFVVSNTDSKTTCTLSDLSECKELRKLGLYIRVDAFPSKDQLRGLNCLKSLTKLTIAWGRSRGPVRQIQRKRTRYLFEIKKALSRILSSARSTQTGAPPTMAILPPRETEPELPSQLEKLELECLPFTYPPSWLRACKLMNLKKLSLKGGELSYLPGYTGSLGYENENVWKVEKLHLKYMNNLEMKWSELQQQFPVLKYLKKVNCPRLSFFPCDGNGVWTARRLKATPSVPN